MPKTRKEIKTPVQIGFRDNTLSTVRKLVRRETARKASEHPPIAMDPFYYHVVESVPNRVPHFPNREQVLVFGAAPVLHFDDWREDYGTTPLCASAYPYPQDLMYGIGFGFLSPVFNLYPGQSRFTTPFGLPGTARITTMCGGTTVFRVASNDDYCDLSNASKLITLSAGRMSVWTQGFFLGPDGDRKYSILDIGGKFKLYYEFEDGVTSRLVFIPNSDHSFRITLDLGFDNDFGNWFAPGPRKLVLLWDFSEQLFEIYYNDMRGEGEPIEYIPMPQTAESSLVLGNSFVGEETVGDPNAGLENAYQHFDEWTFARIPAGIFETSAVDGHVAQSLIPLHDGPYREYGDPCVTPYALTPINLGSADRPFDKLYVRTIHEACRGVGAGAACDRVVIVSKDGSGDYTTIQEGLNYAGTQASAGEVWVVRVCPGEYTERLIGKNYVHLIGIADKRGAVVIRDNNGVMLTVQTGSGGIYRNLDFRSEGSQCVLIPALTADHNFLFHNCRLRADIEDDEINSLMEITDGKVACLDVRFLILETHSVGTAGAKWTRCIYMNGDSEIHLHSCNMTIEIADDNNNHTAVLIEEVSTATIETVLHYNSMHIEYTHADWDGACGAYYAHGIASEKHVDHNHIHLKALAGIAYVFYLDTTSNNGHLHSTCNFCKTEGFDNGYFAHAATGDTFYSHADDAREGFTGAGTFYFASSLADGNWSISGDLQGGVSYCVNYDIINAAATVSILALRSWQDETVLPVSYLLQPEVPRTVTVTASPEIPGVTLMTGTVTINGLNADGAVVADVITVNTNVVVTYETNVAFGEITSIVTDQTDVLLLSQYSVGLGDKIGLPNSPFNAAGDVFKVSQTSIGFIAVPAVSATYGTVDLAVIVVPETYVFWYRPFA